MQEVVRDAGVARTHNSRYEYVLEHLVGKIKRLHPQNIDVVSRQRPAPFTQALLALIFGQHTSERQHTSECGSWVLDDAALRNHPI